MTDEEKKLRDREKRYLKKYGPFMTMELYNKILAAQDYKCGACGRPATDFTVSMNIDHFHFKVVAERTENGCHYMAADGKAGIGKGWQAVALFPDHFMMIRFAKTKTAAITLAKTDAMPHSIRGLLCPGRYTGCNRLMGRIDKPDWLRKVITYLENPPARKVLTF